MKKLGSRRFGNGEMERLGSGAKNYLVEYLVLTREFFDVQFCMNKAMKWRTRKVTGRTNLRYVNTHTHLYIYADALFFEHHAVTQFRFATSLFYYIIMQVGRFAWHVAHDWLVRIIGDAEEAQNTSGSMLATTNLRENEIII
jgi:hypothetical protein